MSTPTIVHLDARHVVGWAYPEDVAAQNTAASLGGQGDHERVRAMNAEAVSRIHATMELNRAKRRAM